MNPRRLSRILATLTLVMAHHANGDPAPPPGAYAITQFAIRGSGCTPGSVAADLAPDNRAFTLLFSNFIVSADSATHQDQKYCELDMKMAIPSGWSVAVATADIRGYADLADKQSFGVVNSVYALRGARSPVSLMRQRFVGPYSSDYQLHSSLAQGNLVFSPCGKSRLMRLRSTIRSRLAPKSQSGGAMLTVDSEDGEVRQTYGLAWKQCNHADDPDDSGKFPDLGINVTAVCDAALKAHDGSTVDTFEGSAVGSDADAATRAARADALQQCRADHRQAPGTSCAEVAGSCSTAQD